MVWPQKNGLKTSFSKENSEHQATLRRAKALSGLLLMLVRLSKYKIHSLF